MTLRILVAGVGNIFLEDDGFGVAVAQQLQKKELPSGVHVVDFGIRGVDLAFALLDGFDGAILVDTIRRGGPPGTVYVLAPDQEDIDKPGNGTGCSCDTHDMHSLGALRLVQTMGGKLPTLRIVGCEPASLGGEQGAMGLTAPVQAAVAEAAALVLNLITGRDSWATP
jgi:hydrogenase maturation protease